MTRYDNMMQKMTIEEMARLIARQRQPCEQCVWADEGCFHKVCDEGIKKWLMEEDEAQPTIDAV